MSCQSLLTKPYHGTPKRQLSKSINYAMTQTEKIRVQKEIEQSITRKKKTYLWDWDGSTWVFDLPSPQTTGTMLQQQTYAKLKAEAVLRSILAIEKHYTELRNDPETF